MLCPNCGKEVSEDFKYCPYCSFTINGNSPSTARNKFRRVRKPSFIGAAGAGIALLGCVLPFLAIGGVSIISIIYNSYVNFLNYCLSFGNSQNVNVQDIVRIAGAWIGIVGLMIFIALFILSLVFDIIGLKKPARVFGIVNFVFILIILFIPLSDGINLITVMFQYKIAPGPGLIFMLIGSIGIALSL